MLPPSIQGFFQSMFQSSFESSFFGFSDPLKTVLVGVSILVGVVSCGASNVGLRTARGATYQADPAVLYKQALATVSSMYPVEELRDPGNRKIYTRWQPVKSSRPMQLTNSKEDRRLRGGGGAIGDGQNQSRYIRFQIEVVGDSPWQVKVIGQASETAPTWESRPTLLPRAKHPAWFRSRINDVQLAIHQSLKVYAVEFDCAPRSSPETRSQAAQASAKGEPSADTESWAATVHVRGTSPGSRVSALSMRLQTQGVYWKELCTTPCSFKLMPGDQNLRVESGHGRPTERLQLEPGSSTYLFVKPGSE